MKSLRYVAVAFAALAGCEDDPPPAPPPPPRPPAAAADATPGPGQSARRAGQEEPPPVMQITDNTFNEPPARDPFRSYAIRFVTQVTEITNQRDVKLARYSIDDLRLVAVVIGTDSPYAMVTDPSSTGTILRRGMYVGRAEVVHALNVRGSDYAVHWRVARITPARLRRGEDGQFVEQPAEVVFERQNPLDPTAQVVERSINLAARTGAETPASAPAIGPIPGINGATPGYLPPNLGGAGAGGGNSAITGTQSAVNGLVGAPPPQTVVVQVPPSQPAVVPNAPSNAPPPVQIYNGSGTAR